MFKIFKMACMMEYHWEYSQIPSVRICGKKEEVISLHSFPLLLQCLFPPTPPAFLSHIFLIEQRIFNKGKKEKYNAQD